MMQQLVDAYLTGEYCFGFVYNRKTKEVYIPLDDEDWEEDEAVVPVPYKESRQMYEVMVDFSNQFSEEIEEVLFRALNNRKPFRQFNEAAGQLGLLEQWDQFVQQFAEQRIKEWLEQLEEL